MAPSSTGPSSSEASVTVDVHSLLSKLKCPTPSNLSRKRKIKSNSPKGLKRSKGTVAMEPLFLLPPELKNFPMNIYLCTWYLKSCFVRLVESMCKKSVLHQHIISAKHDSNKKVLAYKKAQDKTIADMLKKEKHPVGESLSDEVRVFRINPF